MSFNALMDWHQRGYDVAMAEERRTDDVEKLLAEEKAIEERKKSLISELLKQREATIKDFDERLAKLGYAGNGRQKRSHHKKAGQVPTAGAKGKA
jgi:hypothetical protein